MPENANKTFDFNTPIAFFFFNKMDTTLRVFEQIKKIKPNRLYLISDGGRAEKENEIVHVQQLREQIVSQIDWECDVKKDFSSQNLGCKKRMASGISWVFSQEDKAIILEDDCLPNQSFFEFCQEMLNKYQNDNNVMMVSGTNLFQSYSMDRDYSFSCFPSIWGWATWKRAWKHYDIDIKQWIKDKKNRRLSKQFTFLTYLFKAHNWDRVCFENMDTWDYQWDFCMAAREGLGIIPRVNLVENIGFDHAQATHTSQKSDIDFRTQEMEFPLNHPQKIDRNLQYDLEYQHRTYNTCRVIKIIKKRLTNRR